METSYGFIKLERSHETFELLKDPTAFILLTTIALRARRTDEFNIHDLRSGEALVGDHDRCGLTRRQYRTAMRRLARWGFAAFRPTTRGTIATLCDTSIYDINETAGGQQVAAARPTASQRAAPNKNEKNEKKEKKYSLHSDEWRLSELLLAEILTRKPDFRRPALERWAREIDRLLRLDGRTPARVEAVIRWCRQDPFWANNILSPAKLRKHFDRLELEMDRRLAAATGESTRDMVARMEQEGQL